MLPAEHQLSGRSIGERCGNENSKRGGMGEQNSHKDNGKKLQLPGAFLSKVMCTCLMNLFRR